MYFIISKNVGPNNFSFLYKREHYATVGKSVTGTASCRPSPTKQRIRRTPPNSRLHHRLCQCIYTLLCIVIGHFLRPFACLVCQTHSYLSLCTCRILLKRFVFYWLHSIHIAMAQIKDEKMDMSMNGPNNGNHKPKEEFHGGGRGGRGNRFQPYSGPNRDRKGPRDNNMVI